MTTSTPITHCQVCGHEPLQMVFHLGWLPLVNTMQPVGKPLQEEARYPAQLFRCPKCALVQIGCEVRAGVLFPPSYAYRSGTTEALRNNFKELAEEAQRYLPKGKSPPLVVDIASNDGSLLSCFRQFGWRVYGVEPTGAGRAGDVPWVQSFFNESVVDQILFANSGPVDLLTCTNAFAHMPDINGVMKNVSRLLTPNGVFITESHYLHSLLSGVQYDAIYHEHLRHYSLTSLSNLLDRYGFEVFRAKLIPTHGGSIRVFAARKGVYPVEEAVTAKIREEEELGLHGQKVWEQLTGDVLGHKVDLSILLCNLPWETKVFGIGAPSRAVTLANHVGLNSHLIQAIAEVPGSPKVGYYLPGTDMPIVDEKELYEQQPEYALLFSWHLADDLIPKLRAKGFKGKFVVPLPEVKVVE